MSTFRMTLPSPRPWPLAAVLTATLVLGCAGKPETAAAEDKAGPQNSTPPAKSPQAAPALDKRSEDTPTRFHAAWKRKLTAANETLAKNPKDAAAYTERAALYHERRAYKPAFDEAEKALAAKPDQAEALRIRGICQQQLGRASEARADLQEAMKLQPTNGRIVVSYATYQREKGSPALAWLEALRAVELDRKSSPARNVLGSMFKKTEQFDKALLEYDEAIQLDPSYKFPYYSRGQIYARSGNYPAALRDFDRVVELDPTYRRPYVERQAIYEKLGFTISAVHNERMSQVIEMLENRKKQCDLVTFEIPMKVFLQRFPSAGKPPPQGRENWSVADVALWGCVEMEENVSYQLALLMLAEGADVRQIDSKTGNSLLHVCIEKNTSALIVRLLLRNGADPAVKNRNGFTPADLLRQRMLASLPTINPPTARAKVKAAANGLTDKTFASVIEGSFEPRILQFLADAKAQWAAIKKEKKEYEKVRARMGELGQAMIVMMARTRTPLDGVDPKEIGRAAQRLAEGVPEFKSTAAQQMVFFLDAALWNARLCYGRDDPRYLAVVKQASEILNGKGD